MRRAGSVIGAVLAVTAVVPSCARAADSDEPPSTRGAGRHIPTCARPDPACQVSAAGVSLRVTGPAGAPEPVAPADDHPLATIDRDAGVAAVLRDGSILWLFGDTAARADDGTLSYFVIGTASWAPPGAPLETHDAIDPARREPVAFAAPTAEFPACPDPAQRPGMWPAAAVVDAVGPRDRVLVWMENVCLGAERRLDDAGMSIAEWWYDPAAPPDGTPIVATMLNQRLFPERSYGSAAVPARELPGSAATDRGVYVYRCHNTTDGGKPDDYGPCWVARTTFEGVADPQTYQEWDGDAFSADVGDGQPIVLPGGRSAAHPPAGFSVAFDREVGGLVMAYSPWPGPSTYVDLRVAGRPQGPWSEPVTVTLEGCADRIGSREFPCYAGNVQPWRSEPGRLGIGYYDSQVTAFPTRGRFQITTVPIEQLSR